MYNPLISEKLMGKPDAGEVTLLLRSWSRGNRAALDQLIPLVYRELCRIATAYLRRERSDHTLQASALVHEAYLRLVNQKRVEGNTRAQFFAIAAKLMREILVNHAEKHQAAKRGGGNKVALEEGTALIGEPQLDLLALDRALHRLAELDPRQSRIVELRFFGGLTEEEIAEVVGISPVTVGRDWRTAKAVLHKELRSGGLN
jgi:RNA polymerase sigma factor (TIGR02999 family)